MRYLVAIPLPESEAGNFIDLRDSYRHYAPRWKLTLGPHITIHRPQESLLSIGRAVELFSNSPVCQGFTMSFNKIDAFIGKRNSAIYFEPDNYVPFYVIRKSYQSVAEQILKNTAEEWDFHPHLTLINRLSSDAAQLVLKELRSRPIHFTYNLGRVCLYKKETEDNSWQEIAQNKLY